MVTVKVFAYKDDLGIDCEDFVLNDGVLFPLCASIDEEDRKTTALRCLQGDFFGLNVDDHMDEAAVLIATYTFEEEV
jgi:hypothetical protein